MKPIAQRPFPTLMPRRQHNAANLLLFPVAVHYKLCTGARRLYHLIRPNVHAIAEGFASAVWLLLLIFGLNLFAALV